MAVDTRRAERRDLTFESLHALESELDLLGAAHERGTLRHTGNWAPGEVLEHCAIFWRCALDGFPGRVAWPLRVGGAVLKPLALRGGRTPAGLKIPRGASYLRPGEGVSFELGLASLRRAIGRTRDGERFGRPSPLFGRLTHEQWLRLQLGHCALHLGFLHPDGSGEES